VRVAAGWFGAKRRPGIAGRVAALFCPVKKKGCEREKSQVAMFDREKLQI
jgi:hypothetical protein